MTQTAPDTDQTLPTPGGIALFVRRPILAFVFSALIIIAGLAGLLGVEVRELPNVDRPVITVRTNFDGASPETVDQELTNQIEGAVGRVSGISKIASASEFGSSRVTLEFGDGVDLDVAASDARDAIARIANSLPEGADEPSIVKADANAQPIIRLAITSATRSPQDLTAIVQDQVEDRIISIGGVADLQIYGERTPIFRVDIDTAALASRGLTLADMRDALSDVSFDVPAGDLSGTRQSVNVRTTATVNTPEAFGDLELADNVFIRDVATVTLGPAPGETVLRANGQTGLGLGIIRQATSNTLDISRDVRAVVADLDAVLPDDVSIFVTSDDAVFIEGAIREVILSLLLATAIVVVVIFVFLRDWRATLIPALTLPVSLIGTLAAIYLIGFSVNILTLLALVLATGMVVDDAIVVLENIVRRRSQGMGARAAAVLGTQEVFFAVVTTTAVLAAVFIPLSFLPGQAGGLFREFGFTLAISVMLSSVVALTLCPVLASRLLTRDTQGVVQRGPLVWLGARLEDLYAATLRGALAAPLVVILVAGLFAAAAVVASASIRSELTPQEDRSVALLRISVPQGVSVDYTNTKMLEIEGLLDPLRESGEITSVFAISGLGGNGGFMVLSLAGWEERERNQAEIVTEINGKLRGIVGVRAFAVQPNSLGIRGGGQGLNFAITGGSYEQLGEVQAAMAERMRQVPELGDIEVGYETTQPQLFIDIDRRRAADLGIDISGLGPALQAVLKGAPVGSVFIDDTSYDIEMLSTLNPVDDPGDLENIFIQTGEGQMVPMSTFVTLEERAIAPELKREEQNRAVDISASLTDDISLGDALTMVEEMADEVFEEQNTLIPLAEAATLDETANGLIITFGFALLIVFLVLAAQFESFVSAIVVMATVPLGVACAMFALLLSGQSLNVYSQIGLVMLVGIMAKNGILIVEFANQLRDKGQDVRSAIMDASTIRLRPVMMTMVSTVLGGVPLILSSGAGAEAREALGWVIVGGLGLATISTLYLTPVAYLLLAGFSKPRVEEEARLKRELRDAQSLGV
ncbi:hydrophobic/amphiphilic exporter-1, HAE1 family [Loktanella fryxellensis]|uniref:Hydrophobic/amphiphilic exporter-1, HAE1 family n=1 Tax=Loktanella fryxellensis TaxID=245187 RepID=A0A1H8AU32_9RHOB|nr:efflux RND transporter permease subunit [Loktanella fryxellensis]SEM73474.1 hydrophobic/amphiphilic exporter-1, HAE1 family [Loktanella fryxellensis]